MKNLKRFRFLFVVFSIYISLLGTVYSATNYKPTDRFFVNDFGNVLSSDTENLVYNNCIQIQEKTAAQLVVVTVPSLDGSDIETYSNRLFNNFEIGQKDKDNGVLLLISKADRKVRIEVGYGLEGALNDAKTGRILDDKAIPSLKNNDYDTAVINVVTELQGIIYNEYGVEGGFDNYSNVTNDQERIEPIISTIGTIIMIIIILLLNRRGIFFFGGFGGRGGFGGGSSGGGFSGGGGRSGGGGSSRGF